MDTEPFLLSTMLLAVLALHDAQVVVADHPSCLALICGCLNTELAVPPMWKVRMVSCVPGSPMDCAAMMPTASPSLTSRRWPGCARSTWRRPARLSQVRTLRIFTLSMPAFRSMAGGLLVDLLLAGGTMICRCADRGCRRRRCGR
jgi:hypothetical protein